MPEDDILDEDQQVQPAQGPSTDDLEKAQKRIRALERDVKFYELSASHPGLQREDFKGVDVREWERLATRLAQQAAPTAPQEPAAPQGQPPQERQPSPSEETLTKAAQLSGATGAPAPTLVGPDEAIQKVRSGEWTEADYRNNADLRLRQTSR